MFQKALQKEIRCGQCHRKLAEGTYTALVIKCPRCKTLNHLQAKSLPPERQPAAPPSESHHA